jgi:hypothetical protein
MYGALRPFLLWGGSRYFVIFVDGFSRYTWLYFLQNRFELSKIYSKFQKMVHTQFSCNIKIFRSNNAIEYRESTFLTTLKQNGTLPHRSCPSTSQQNGHAECKQHILDAVQTLLLSASIPEHFWGDAALIAVYTINRVPSPPTLNKSPYELLYGSPLNYQLLRVFSCFCFVLLQPHEHTKPCSRLCFFLGYDIEHKSYRCYDPIAKPLRISRHVTFWEHHFFSSMESFPPSPSSASPIFTDVSFDLLPEPTNLDAGTISSFDLLPESTNLDAGTISSSDDFLTSDSNLPDPPADPPNTSSETPHFSPRRSTWVKTLLTHLCDYHCFSTIATLHEPHSFREARTDPLWQKLCLKNSMLSPKLTLGT